jgi:hypothetical protein
MNINGATGTLAANGKISSLSLEVESHITASGAISSSRATTAGRFITQQNSLESTGNSQGTAALMNFNAGGFFPITNGSNNSGIRLPSLITVVNGSRVDIINLSLSNNLRVFPNTGQAIGTLAANAAATLTPGQSLTLYRISDDQWFGSVGDAIS